MEIVILVAVACAVGWFYSAGKRDGSRKGYAAGRFRRRR